MRPAPDRAAGAAFTRQRRPASAIASIARIPVITGQSISAYDPRVVEVTGISMMVSAQGDDHTAGNLPQGNLPVSHVYAHLFRQM